MPQQYTVETKNAFEAFNDDSGNDGDTILSKSEEVRHVTASTGTIGKHATVVPNVIGKPPTTRGTSVRRGPGFGRRAVVVDDGPESVIPQDFEGSARPPMSAPRGFTTRRGARGSGVRTGQREFERHSGTGRVREVRREGGGPYNWGKQTDFGTEGEGAEVVEPLSDVEAKPVEEVEDEIKAAVVEEPQTPEIMTYAAYKASIDEKRAAAAPTKNIETKEDPQTALDRITQEGYHVFAKKELSASASSNPKDSRSVRKSNNEPEDITAKLFAQSSKTGKRPGQGPTAGRSTSPRQEGPTQQSAKEINLADNQAFPTLQAH